MAAPADLDGLDQLVPLLIGIDGIWITALLQHFLKRRFVFLIPESGRLAGPIAVVLVVTVPDVIAFAFTAQPPDFVAIKTTAITADKFSGQWELRRTFSRRLADVASL